MKREERPELPEEAIREAVVNALAHRDYRSTANVQIYLFTDRLEIVSPGGLPAGMSEADLGIKSVPRNPLLFSILHRMEAVENIGSGIRRIRELCRDYKVAEPLIDVSENWVTTTFARPVEHAADRGTRHATPQVPLKRPPSTPEVTPEVIPEVTTEVSRLLRVISGAMERQSLQEALGLKAEKNFRLLYLRPAIEAGWLEMTVPDRPRSSKQKYRHTERGRALQDQLRRTQ